MFEPSLCGLYFSTCVPFGRRFDFWHITCFLGQFDLCHSGRPHPENPAPKRKFKLGYENAKNRLSFVRLIIKSIT